jgi:hypothetical protein
MATRAIKKLTKTNDLKKLSELAKEDEDQTESDSEPQLAPVNKFDLVFNKINALNLLLPNCYEITL